MNHKNETDIQMGVTIAERELLRLVRAVRFGSLEVIVHDGQIVQVERTEKVRFDTGGTHAQR